MTMHISPESARAVLQRTYPDCAISAEMVKEFVEACETDDVERALAVRPASLTTDITWVKDNRTNSTFAEGGTPESQVFGAGRQQSQLYPRTWVGETFSVKGQTPKSYRVTITPLSN
jgi:hypothetical protein